MYKVLRQDLPQEIILPRTIPATRGNASYSQKKIRQEKLNQITMINMLRFYYGWKSKSNQKD